MYFVNTKAILSVSYNQRNNSVAKKKIVQDEFQPSMNFPCQVINLGIEAANGNSDGENFRVMNGDVMGSLCPEVLH